MTTHPERLREAQGNGLIVELLNFTGNWFQYHYQPSQRELDWGWKYRISLTHLPKPEIEVPEGWEEIHSFEKDGRFNKKAAPLLDSGWSMDTEIWLCENTSRRYVVRTSDILAYYAGRVEKRSGVNHVWNTDAPDSMCWKCPDCDYRATLGGNAAYHATKEKHGVPKLVPMKVESDPQDAAQSFSLTMPQLIRLFNLGYSSGHHDTVEGQYTDIFNEDKDSYHAEDVQEIVIELTKTN